MFAFGPCTSARPGSNRPSVKWDEHPHCRPPQPSRREGVWVGYPDPSGTHPVTSSGKSDKSREMIRDRPTFPQSGRSRTDPRSDGEDWCGREIEVASPQRTGSCRWRRTHCSVTDDNQVGAWLFIEVRQTTRFTHGQKRGAADIENVHDFAGAAAVATGVRNQRWKKSRGGRRAPRQEEAEVARRADVGGPQVHELELRVASVAAHDKHVVADGLPATVAAGRRSEKERRARVARLSQRAPRQKCVEIFLNKGRVQRWKSPTVEFHDNNCFRGKSSTAPRAGQGRAG